MFKNKKIKKLFSVVCTVLTLNFTSSIFQHNPSAIKFKTTKDEDGCESTSVTLDKPFYCIVVYDKQWIHYHGQQNNWNNIPLADLLFDGADVHGPHEVTTLRVSANEYINNMQKFLNEVSDEAELLIVVCLTDQKDLCNIPPLPYSFMATPQLKCSDVMQDLKKQLTEQTFHHLVFPDNEGKKLITLETTIYEDSDDLICEYTLAQDEKFSRTYTSGDKQTKPRNELWHLRETERIITVQKLKSWIGQNTPGMINNSDLTNKKANQHTLLHLQPTNHSHTPAKIHLNSQIKPPPIIIASPAEMPQRHTPPEALHHRTDTTRAEQQKSGQKPPTSGIKAKQNDPKPKILMEEPIKSCDAQSIAPRPVICNNSAEGTIGVPPEQSHPVNGQNNPLDLNKNSTRCTLIPSVEKPNFLRTTNKFIQNNPKTTVGLGAAIVALVGTIIYKIQKLFTRESPKSQIKHQVHHVKNKI